VDPLDDAPTVPNLLRRAAARFGPNDYLVTPDRRLTFDEAEQRSRLLAKRLLRAGVGKATRVGMVFPQGPDFVVALLAITRIGALAVPLSTFLRGPEMRRALRHGDVELLLAAPAALDATWPELAAAGTPPLFLEDAPYLRDVWVAGSFDALDDDTGIGDGILAEIETEVRPSDLMVMIHTSGATAEPKAVVHTHGAQIRHARTLAPLYSLTESTRTFTTMPFFWVGGLTVSLLTHLHVGAMVLTVERMDATVIVDFLEREHPTRVVGWSLMERLASDPALAGRDLAWLAGLQPPNAVHPGRRHNSLGMTETSGPHTAVAAADNEVDLAPEQLGSFGRPVPGVEHKIVDGEICVRGYSLMDGLYKRERAQTFDADGWYHTGDAGSFRDGLLFFTGRTTEMIKTGGANVAPREVELAVESLPGVQAAFVVGLPDPDRGQLVGCMVCAEPGHDLEPAWVAEQLRDQLSSYKIPRRIVVVRYDDAPWLPSGKISKPRVVELLTAEQGG
jgi:acyl-CoA synthetase (AMP-forming)/AMP-acid ligase II